MSIHELDHLIEIGKPLSVIRSLSIAPNHPVGYYVVSGIVSYKEIRMEKHGLDEHVTVEFDDRHDVCVDCTNSIPEWVNQDYIDTHEDVCYITDKEEAIMKCVKLNSELFKDN